MTDRIYEKAINAHKRRHQNSKKEKDEEKYEHRSWRKIEREREQNIRISM
jgi:hypothetical protein